MNMRSIHAAALLLTAFLALGGCATRPPTIAHTHIGHAMTGWPDTPGQKGLFVTAEDAGRTALKEAEKASAKGNDLAEIKHDVSLVILATDPESSLEDDATVKTKYGLRNALTAAVNHINYAADSRDASENVRKSAPVFTKHAQVVLDRCDLVVALGNDILQSRSPDDARLLVGQLTKLTDANVNGAESNGDGVPGSVPAEYGMKQLRAELQAMINREDPPYRTVDRWYLFNLIRLPSGEWIFRHFSHGSTTGSGSPY